MAAPPYSLRMSHNGDLGRYCTLAGVRFTFALRFHMNFLEGMKVPILPQSRYSTD